VHPFRFGVTMSRAHSAEAWVASARRAEELGYDILLMPDHLGSQLSRIAALTAAAATNIVRTSRRSRRLLEVTSSGHDSVLDIVLGDDPAV
jgi:alkanesulfonate monooxygenase SsuD/methylene tetrahydromethanopterin reductase-like flavin-dependent oxidoreductase (luciferase family)